MRFIDVRDIDAPILSFVERIKVCCAPSLQTPSGPNTLDAGAAPVTGTKGLVVTLQVVQHR